ncbi:MAG: manganese efflux pump [Bacilli bacterium]
MTTLLTSILIGLGLSMDAFSLSLIYGTLNLSKKNILQLSIIVGICHFIMPLIGLNIGYIIIKNILLEPFHLVSIIFFIIGVQMIVSDRKEEPKIFTNLWTFILFGITVSIDSFSIGIGLNIISDNIILSVIIFSIISFTFTYIGLLMGNKIGKKIGKYSVVIGGVILILIAIYYLTK